MAATTASSAPPAGAVLDALLDRITALKLQQKSIDAELCPLLEQLSGALEATWGVHYDAGQTIWARPGEARFSPLYSREECLAAWAAAWAGYVSRFRPW